MANRGPAQTVHSSSSRSVAATARTTGYTIFGEVGDSQAHGQDEIGESSKVGPGDKPLEPVVIETGSWWSGAEHS